MTTINHETRVAALAHHLAFFYVMAVATCEGDEVTRKTDMALDLWLDQHGYASREENLDLAIEAHQKASPIMIAAIRATSVDGEPDVGAAGRQILQWTEDKGLARLQFIQRPMN